MLTQQQRFLKALVIGLGVAIVFALGMVIYGFVRLSGDSGEQQSSVREDEVIAPFKATDLGQPIGTDITQVVPLGGSRLALTLRGGSLPDRIAVLDVKTGQLLGITYTTAPTAP